MDLRASLATRWLSSNDSPTGLRASFSVVTGRMTHPDGRAYWETLDQQNRRELPLRTRDVLRWWRLKPWPPIEWWTGPVDWIYCPAEYFVATGRARLAVTSHDVLQTLRFEPLRKRELLGRIFARSDLILSVSHFNTRHLQEAFAIPDRKVAYVPNGGRPLLSVGLRARAQPSPCRPGASPRRALSSVCRQFSAPEKPAAPRQGGHEASRG